MTCAVCKREARGFGFRDPVPEPGKDRPLFLACSMKCLMNIHDCWKTRDMDNLTKHESEAVRAAIPEVGDVIEAIGKSDLAQMTPAEFERVISAAFTRTAANLQRIVDENTVPF